MAICSGKASPWGFSEIQVDSNLIYLMFYVIIVFHSKVTIKPMCPVIVQSTIRNFTELAMGASFSR